jgi:hypothetical protein
MSKPEHRRRSSRHAVRWQAAVVFDHPHGKPVVHTETEDLSADGAAIATAHGDLTGSVVTLLLALPSRKSGEAPRVHKVRARVVSTVRSPGMQRYRHGLSFARAPGDGLDELDRVLGGAAAQPQPAEAAQGSRVAPPLRPAQARAAEGEAREPQEQIDAAVSGALERAYRYLRSFAQNLNAEHPSFPRGYAIPGVPEFGGLMWLEGQVDYHTREVSPAVRLYERVSLRYLLSARKHVHVEREFPASQKLEQFLADSGIEFSSQGTWNKRGSLVKTTFEFPCDVAASLVLQGQFDTGRLLLRASNVAGFGTVEQILAPAAVSEKSLGELAAFILGESAYLGGRLLQGA